MTSARLFSPPPSSLEQRRAAATAQQDAVVSAAPPLVVLACPGAGKTRTIVERHCATPRDQPTGRVIVSFTKVAAAQIRRRARDLGRPDLLQHPHVITTLDGFFWRFLVRPFMPAPDTRNPRTYQHLENWRAAPRRLRQIDYIPDRNQPRVRHPFDLAEFQFHFRDRDGKARPVASLSRSALYESSRRRLTDDQINTVCRLAEEKRSELANNHRLVTGTEVRMGALHYLQKHTDLLAQTLKARFTELIVDEAQDCSDVDVDILRAIQNLVLPTLVIGDPDQAIYTFRSPGPPAINRLIAGAPQLALTGNWRSSAVVCALAATMRENPKRRQPDTALPDHHNSALPVQLIPLDNGNELTVFDGIATSGGIPATKRMILAHGTATLPGVGYKASQPPKNTAKALIWAVGTLRQTDPGRKATLLAEEIIQESLVRHWIPDTDSTGPTTRAATYGIDPYHLRRLAAQALADLPDLSLPATRWCADARQILDNLPPLPHLQRAAGTRLTCPQGSGTKPASELAGLSATPSTRPATRADVIHQVKGEEADAVLVLLPDDDRTDQLLAHWRGDPPPTTPLTPGAANTPAEALRVLYVAVTRARLLVALALPHTHLATTADHLRDCGVPVNELVPTLFPLVGG
jgi:DNA helicase II / ATP-dependent DNA helicase PcrA